MRQAKNAPQLIIGRAEAVANNNQRRRGLTGMVEDVPRQRQNAVCDGNPDSAEQIGRPIDHASTVGAARTYFNLTICALRT